MNQQWAAHGLHHTWMTGAGLASPVVSIMMASNLVAPRRFSSLPSVRIRSPRTAAAHWTRALLLEKS